MPAEHEVVKPTDEKTRELENALHTDQNILDILQVMDERLSRMCGRLSGDNPKVSTEGVNADAPPGIMGQFLVTHSAIHSRCDSINGWLERLEDII